MSPFFARLLSFAGKTRVRACVGGSAVSVLLGLCTFACLGCGGRSLVHGFVDSEGSIYRQSEQEDFDSRTMVRVRGFEL